MEHQNLLGGPAPTYLPEDEDAAVALREAHDTPAEVAARFPAYSAAWAALAVQALWRDDAVTAYAYARTGYHRGLDQLRRAGWHGHGPIPRFASCSHGIGPCPCHPARRSWSRPRW